MNQRWTYKCWEPGDWCYLDWTTFGIEFTFNWMLGFRGFIICIGPIKLHIGMYYNDRE